jgi:hypothetical protein
MAVSALQPKAIGPVTAKIVVPLARSYLIPGMQIRAMTCRNVVRGKTTSWLHNLGRSGERAVRRRSLVIKRAITVDVGATECPDLGGSNHGTEGSGWAPDRLWIGSDSVRMTNPARTLGGPGALALDTASCPGQT